MSKRIPLSNGGFAIVDDADFNWLSQHKWLSLNTPTGHKYAIRRSTITGRNEKSVLMHRELLGLIHAPRTIHVDHKNGDTLDNRRENIRACNSSLNVANSRGRWGRSEFRGVHWDGARNLWRAKITHSGKYEHLGRFESEIEAARAYDNAANKYFGEFANLNFPLSP